MKALAAIVAAVAVVAGVSVPLAVTQQPSPQVAMAPMPDKFITPVGGEEVDGSPMPPTSGANPDLNCGPDMTTVLENFLTNLPKGTTEVTFPQDACYTVDKGIVLQNIKNLIINGNGATFNAWPPTGGARVATAGTSSTVTLASTAGIAVGMVVTGTNAGSSASVTAVNSGTGAVTVSGAPGPFVAGTTCSPRTSTGCYTFDCQSGSCDSQVPVLFLAADTNVTVENLNIQGAWDGSPNFNGACQCGHGVWYEGRVGMMLQGNTNVTITGSTIQGTQGDGFSVPAPSGTGSGFLPGAPVNRDITLANSTLNNVGYTLTVESVIGLTITGITLNNYQQIDFEVDGGGSGFNCQSCDPVFAAQDKVLITNSVFSNFNEFWFTSLQGPVLQNPGFTHTSVGFSPTTLTFPTSSNLSNVAKGQVVTGAGIGTFATVQKVNQTTKVVTLTAPASPGPLQTGAVYTFAAATCPAGVTACVPAGCVGTACTSLYGIQQVDVTLSGNTIKCTGPCNLVQTLGVRAGNLQSRYFNIGLNITGNTLEAAPTLLSSGGAKSTSGGSLCSHTSSGSAMTFKDVNRVSITGNLFPANYSLPGVCSPPANGPTPYLWAIQGTRVSGLTIKNNRFPGAFGILNPSSTGNTNEVNCNNTYGINGTSNDGSC